MSESTATNKPSDSPFKQQRLKAWQPILTPNWVVGTFVLIGIVFLPIGIALLSTSNSVSGLQKKTTTIPAPCSPFPPQRRNTFGHSPHFFFFQFVKCFFNGAEQKIVFFRFVLFFYHKKPP
jgi:hypothetical protein